MAKCVVDGIEIKAPNKRDFEKMANEMARARCPIIQCQRCKWPVPDGYCCQTCGSQDPGHETN